MHSKLFYESFLTCRREELLGTQHIPPRLSLYVHRAHLSEFCWCHRRIHMAHGQNLYHILFTMAIKGKKKKTPLFAVCPCWGVKWNLMLLLSLSHLFYLQTRGSHHLVLRLHPLGKSVTLTSGGLKPLFLLSEFSNFIVYTFLCLSTNTL